VYAELSGPAINRRFVGGDSFLDADLDSTATGGGAPVLRHAGTYIPAALVRLAL
jgi:hypothetical protein